MEGHKENSGIWVGENESARFWLGVCIDLKNRGGEDILIAYKDKLLAFSEGDVYLYYEFPWTTANRLTNEQWRKMLLSSARIGPGHNLAMSVLPPALNLNSPTVKHSRGTLSHHASRQ